MTVVPGDTGTATVICDRCGTEDSAGGATPGSDLVWPLIAGLGWTGSPFATGPHCCPGCTFAAPAQPPVADPGSRSHGASYDIRTSDDFGAAVITPLTDLDAHLVERLRDDLMRAAALHEHVVVDLHAVRSIDSAGLGLLVRARQEAKQHDATFDLVAPSRFVLTVLHTMRLDGVFRAFPDLEAALRAIRRPSGGPTSPGGGHPTDARPYLHRWDGPPQPMAGPGVRPGPARKG